MRRTPALAALVLGLSVTLSACSSGDSNSGGSETSTEVSTTQHNDADVAFATDMIQHHAQALTMVDMTMGRDLAPEVQALADDIRAAQAPEIETMTDWLTEWGEEVPETVRDHANAGHGSAGHGTEGMEGMEGMEGGMPGMMSADDMAALEGAGDGDFQAMWLEMMVEHHEGAVEMAEDEMADGQYKPAVDLAEDIVESQTAEIETMQGLRGVTR
jgi:uncharacterized protein (DUF305 family)